MAPRRRFVARLRRRRLPPVWRRDWRCYLRFPVVRLARLTALAAVAGLGLAATWNGVEPGGAGLIRTTFTGPGVASTVGRLGSALPSYCCAS